MPSPPPPAHPRKPPLPALSGLRTLLAVNVMFFHFTPPHPNFLTPVIANAYVFVGFFFLISGFVLAYNYADRPVLHKRTFYLARLSRVYPVYLLSLLLSLPMLSFEWHAHTHHDFLLGLFLTPLSLQGWSPLLATFWNTVGWTLSAELTLYLVFPYLLRLLAAHNRHLRTRTRIALTLLAVWILGLLPHVAYLLLNPDHLPTPATRFTFAYWLRSLKFAPPAYLCTFTSGILLARLHAAWPLSPASRLRLALGALSALALFFALAVDRLPYILIHGALLLPLFSALLLGLAGPNPLTSALSWRPLALFGETTFALYLLHFNSFLLIHFYDLPARLHLARFDPWISYLAIMALAYLVLRFYERPVQRMLLTRFSTSAPS